MLVMSLDFRRLNCVEVRLNTKLYSSLSPKDIVMSWNSFITCALYKVIISNYSIVPAKMAPWYSLNIELGQGNTIPVISSSSIPHTIALIFSLSLFWKTNQGSLDFSKIANSLNFRPFPNFLRIPKSTQDLIPEL